MSKIADIILNNKWRTSSFEGTVELDRLFKSGVLTMMGSQANAAVSAIDQDNVQSVVYVGSQEFAFEEQNLGGPASIAKDAGAITADYKTYGAKTFYGNKWWNVSNIEQDLMKIDMPNDLVRQTVGAYWATQINKIIGASVSSLARVTEITTGNGTDELSLQMVLDSRNKKAEHGYGELGRMYMSSSTLYAILSKINKGTIPYPIITETHGDLSISRTNPIGTPATPLFQTTAQQARLTPEYKFNGVTPIIVDDSISKGIISMVENGAFGYARKDLTSPLMYANLPKSGNGAGSEEWGTKSLYVVHPLGFSFTGVLAGTGVTNATYANKAGLTLTELLTKKQYSLVGDVKLSKIMNLKVNTTI